MSGKDLEFLQRKARKRLRIFERIRPKWRKTTETMVWEMKHEKSSKTASIYCVFGRPERAFSIAIKVYEKSRIVQQNVSNKMPETISSKRCVKPDSASHVVELLRRWKVRFLYRPPHGIRMVHAFAHVLGGIFSSRDWAAGFLHM